MKHYIQTFVQHRGVWSEICKIRTGPKCSKGDSVKLRTNDIFKMHLYELFGNKTYTVNQVISKKWENMPCNNYLILDGIKGMFLNTIFENG